MTVMTLIGNHAIYLWNRNSDLSIELCLDELYYKGSLCNVQIKIIHKLKIFGQVLILPLNFEGHIQNL